MRFMLKPTLLTFIFLFAEHMQAASLQSRFELELQRPAASKPAKWSPSLQIRMDSQRWVLIDGILGDFSQTLYAQMKMVLRDEVGIQSVDILRPSSVNTILENAELLARELNFIAKKYGQRLVLVAHSRGAVEVFLALLKHPNLLSQDIVAKAILVQGAFDGSPLADLVVNNVGGICSQESSSDFCDLIKQFLPSAASLKVNFVRKERIKAQIQAIDFQKYFQEKILFVRSQSSFMATANPLKPSSIYLNIYFGKNDGLLLTDQEFVSGWGQDLGILPGDHFSLLGGFDQGGASQRAFARALLRYFVSL